MINSVIHAAEHYDFDTIKKFLENGNNVNQLSSYGSSLFTLFVSGYYDSLEYPQNNESEEFFHPEVLLPLSERKDPIEEQLLYLLSKGADPNLIQLNDGDSELALQYAVANLDIPMIEFLLKHGEDPKIWISIDEKEDARYPYSTCNMDDLDIALMNGAYRRKEAYDLVIKAAVLLAQHGIVEYSGCMLSVSKEDREVSVHPMLLRY